MLCTLFNEKSESGENGRPPGSTLRSFSNELPHTLDFFSLRDRCGYTKKGRLRGGNIAHFHQLHLWGFQEKSQVAFASLQAVESDGDIHRYSVGIFLNATPCIIDVHEQRCRYSCRNINIRFVFESTDPHTIKIGSANWDGNAGGGAGSAAGSSTGSGAGRGTGSAAGGGTGSGAGRGTGSDDGSGPGTIRMVGFVATVATPPTPAWMCCRAMVL